MSNEEEVSRVKRFKITKLDTVSPTMCVAKWAQSTIMLYNGTTHSCHHPNRHKIDPKTLLDNPSNLHNTPVKIRAREDLLQGHKTAECGYCWNIENINSDLVSDRMLKSASPWGQIAYKDVIASGLGKSFNPNYLEIAFDSTCNLACMYCTPDVSSKWMEEITSHGPYKFSKSYNMHDLDYLKSLGRIPIKNSEHNPYIEAFWKWWPDLYESLQVFRITGGEPLLSKHLWTMFDWFKSHKNEKLELSINTNLCVPDKLIDKLIENIKAVSPNVSRIKIFTSIEAVGKDAEYIRDGLNYIEWKNNLERILTELPNVRVIISTTLNNLSIFTIEKLMIDVMELRKKFTYDLADSKLGISFNYLRWPTFMDVRVFDKKKTNEILVKALDYIKANRCEVGGVFYIEDVMMFERFIEYALTPIENRKELVVQFREFFNEYDRRRAKSLIDTFPNIEEFLV